MPPSEVPARCEQRQFSFVISSIGQYNHCLRLSILGSAACHVQPIEAHRQPTAPAVPVCPPIARQRAPVFHARCRRFVLPLADSSTSAYRRRSSAIIRAAAAQLPRRCCTDLSSPEALHSNDAGSPPRNPLCDFCSFRLRRSPRRIRRGSFRRFCSSSRYSTQ